MRVGLVINDLEKEDPRYTSVGLAREATARGHETWLIDLTRFTYDPSGALCAQARGIGEPQADQKAFLEALQSDSGRAERIDVGALDVLLLRYNPADEIEHRPWAQHSGVLFAQLAQRAGCIVLNNPTVLATAINKTYFQQFPESVRPRTLITRNEEEVRRFVQEQGGKAVCKPLQGSGGKNVFFVEEGSAKNLAQIVEAIARDGYVVVQEYLPEASKGDVRLFVMNGNPLQADGQVAAVKRVSKDGEGRSNMHAGGRAEKAEVDERMLALVDTIRPKLIKDGMFLVGLDVVGDKLMEVNVFSPGGLNTANQLYEANFYAPVIAALEKKTEYRRHYRRSVESIELATL